MSKKKNAAKAAYRLQQRQLKNGTVQPPKAPKVVPFGEKVFLYREYLKNLGVNPWDIESDESRPYRRFMMGKLIIAVDKYLQTGNRADLAAAGWLGGCFTAQARSGDLVFDKVLAAEFREITGWGACDGSWGLTQHIDIGMLNPPRHRNGGLIPLSCYTESSWPFGFPWEKDGFQFE